MKIKKDSVVTIQVKMYDLEGNLLEQSAPEGVAYLHGHQDIFAGIEKALEGKGKGETVSVTLDPEDAFGEFDPDAIFMCDVWKLGDPETVVPGLVFEGVPGQVNDGRKFVITEIADGQAILDGNHPLAGWTLRFEVTVLDVEKGQGEAVGTDDVVVPEFLGFADKIIDEGDDDDEAEAKELDRQLARFE
ncbi:MAG: FKBP-type peptidyl-prolyl cis-trans isomerase [Duodenibacillus sp.]|nr:FKBP-type peptidyl-prolyl cis-trans isomerase [Duodenibacillus sp.]